MSYRNLEVWKEARVLVIDIHKMTLAELPRFEKYEQGSQIRRSIKSVKANIVEGYSHKAYKLEFVHFLHYAMASLDETIDHLETLHETGSLKNEILYHDLHERLCVLVRKLNSFISSVRSIHKSKK